MNVDKRTFSASLVKGLVILNAFGQTRQPLGIAELADLLQMKASTVHRYVSTLKELGYLEQNLTTKKYHLHFRAIDLGLAAITSLDFREVARPHLQELCRSLGLTTNMTVLDGPEIVYVERILGQKSLDLNLHIGSRQPAYCTSMGKVLIAALDSQDLDDVLQRTDFVKRGPNTITSPERLRKALATVRRLGYAINDEELAPGLRSVAAPLLNASNDTVAAINVNAPFDKRAELIATLVPHVLDAARTISRLLGNVSADGSQSPITS